MELTHTYKGQTITTSIRTTVGASVLRFIIKHAEVFEALSRQGQPFGGSVLSRYDTTPIDKTDHAAELLTRVQQQLDEINRKVATLNNDVRALHTHTTLANKSDRNRAGNASKQDAWKQVIGIERFRALQ
jgi:hypothetical protein